MSTTTGESAGQARDRDTPAAAPGSAAPAGTRAWWSLAIVAVAQLMTVLDLAVVFVALPSIQTSLHVSTADRQWVVSAYAIAFGGLLLLGGRLVDRLGRRRTFIWALLAFGAASALGGAAPNSALLFTARALQGSMAAVVAPAILSLVSVTFTEQRERAKAFAVFGMVSGCGAAVGLILGGVLTQYASWRWCLLINVPPAVIVAVAALFVLPRDRPEPRSGYDVAGSLTATLGLAALAEGFTVAGTSGWGSASTLGILALAVLLLAGFILIEARSRSPLLPLRIVTQYHRALLYTAALLANGAQLSMFLFLTYYMQDTNGYSALHTGFAFLPFAVAVILTANVSTLPFIKVSPLTLMMTGAAMSTLALIALGTLPALASYPVRIMPAEIVMGAGVALSLFPLNNVVLAGIDPRDAGVAGAAISTTQQMGGSLASSLLNSVYAIAAAAYLGVAIHHGNAVGAAVRADDTVFYCEAGMYAIAFVLFVLVAVHFRRNAPSAAERE